MMAMMMPVGVVNLCPHLGHGLALGAIWALQDGHVFIVNNFLRLGLWVPDIPLSGMIGKMWVNLNRGGLSGLTRRVDRQQAGGRAKALLREQGRSPPCDRSALLTPKEWNFACSLLYHS
jgi:hypothetical protein